MIKESRVIVEPAVEPVSLDEAKNQIKLEYSVTAEDAWVTDLISSSRIFCEQITQRQFITATRKVFFDCFPEMILLDRPTCQAVSSLKYIDTSGTLQTLDSSMYQVDIYSEPARVIPAYGQSWPSTRGVLNAVEITYTCGFGDAATDVPAKIKDAMMIYITARYYDREGLRPLPSAFYDSLSHYIVSIPV
jgi:uncharacterized phiE125 gp8 family phage protein